MILELEMVRCQLKAHGVGMRSEPPGLDAREEITKARLMLRAEVDDFLREGLIKGDVVAFAIRLVRCEFAVAGCAARFGAAPEFKHFTDAAIELLQSSHRRLDRALLTQDWEAVSTAIAGVEVILYGLAINIGLPYGNLLKYLDEVYVAAAEVDRTRIAILLRDAGMEVPLEPNEAANDG